MSFHRLIAPEFLIPRTSKPLIPTRRHENNLLRSGENWKGLIIPSYSVSASSTNNSSDRPVMS